MIAAGDLVRLNGIGQQFVLQLCILAVNLERTGIASEMLDGYGNVVGLLYYCSSLCCLVLCAALS